MALLLTTPLESGVEATYWRITGVTLDLEKNRAVVTLGLFLSKQARLAGKVQLEERRVAIESILTANQRNNLIDLIYAGLKTLPQFAGATDDT